MAGRTLNKLGKSSTMFVYNYGAHPHNNAAYQGRAPIRQAEGVFGMDPYLHHPDWPEMGLVSQSYLKRNTPKHNNQFIGVSYHP